MKEYNKPILREYAVFPESMLAEMMKSGRTAKYKKGAYIFRDKYDTENVFILLEGKASIYKLNDSGNKRAVFILNSGSLLNEPVSVSLTSSVNCVAYEDCNVLSINRTKFLELMRDDFDITMRVLDQLSHKIRRMYRQLKNANASTKIEKKVAAKIWKLCLDYGVEHLGSTLISIEITSNNLADLMGVRRETVSRAIKKLQNEGLIAFEKRRIIVFNPDDLSKFFKNL